MLDPLDPESFELQTAMAQIQTHAPGIPDDPLTYALRAELKRRAVARGAPFARLLTTLMGDDALLWLTAESSRGHAKIQPHEFARTGLWRLWNIEDQLEIEHDLFRVPADAGHAAKMVVGLSWTLAALASFVSPSIFLGERLPHLSSLREGGFTVSVGKATHTLVNLDPHAMVDVVHVLAAGMPNPLLTAADLMWMACAVARVRAVTHGHADPVPVAQEGFDVFLSHRGRDAKRPLAEAVGSLPKGHGVFLDCLTLPHGVINRSFIYGSVARSRQVAIVRTENFEESEWCRKEAWFAAALSSRGLVEVNELELDQATELVSSLGSSSLRQDRDPKHEYAIAPRILSDIEYWARAPNLHSLKEAGHSPGSLDLLAKLLASESRPDDAGWVTDVGEITASALASVVAEAPEAEPLDLWATALQYALAAFGATSRAKSKVGVRHGVDQLNSALASFVEADLHHRPEFRERAGGYMALLAAASAIKLADFVLDPRMLPALGIALGDVAGLCDGILLLDARPLATRDFRLHVLALLVRSGIAGVGLVQDADDEVHRSEIRGVQLEMLPCVTLHAGMASPLD
jgi:hypothetical protein